MYKYDELITPLRINEQTLQEQVKHEENHALNSLLMENSKQTLSDIKESLDFTQAPHNTTEFQILPQTQSVHVCKRNVLKL